MTGFVDDWKHFFELRCASSAHPQARELAEPLYSEFVKEDIYERIRYRKTIKARQDARSKELEDAQMLRLFDEIYNSSENGDAYYTFIYEQITPSNLKNLKI